MIRKVEAEAGEMCKTDIVSGSLVFMFGLGAGIEAATYPLGLLRRIGPGAFPVGLAVLLCVAGLVLIVAGTQRRPATTVDHSPAFSLRVVITILGAVGAFALLIELAGLIVTVAVTVVLAALARAGASWRETGALALLLGPLCVMIFVAGLDLPLRLWPF